jgi:hypothetical protein
MIETKQLWGATRSLSPVPTTLSLEDVRKLNAIRGRLQHALRTSDSLPVLRAYVAELACDIEDALAPGAFLLSTRVLRPAPRAHEDEHAADTLRSYRDPWEDQAPSTPHDSAAGKEYGI